MFEAPYTDSLEKWKSELKEVERIDDPVELAKQFIGTKTKCKTPGDDKHDYNFMTALVHGPRKADGVCRCQCWREYVCSVLQARDKAGSVEAVDTNGGLWVGGKRIVLSGGGTPTVDEKQDDVGEKYDGNPFAYLAVRYLAAINNGQRRLVNYYYLGQSGVATDLSSTTKEQLSSLADDLAKKDYRSEYSPKGCSGDDFREFISNTKYLATCNVTRK